MFFGQSTKNAEMESTGPHTPTGESEPDPAFQSDRPFRDRHIFD
jgi:hypothetical protein